MSLLNVVGVLFVIGLLLALFNKYAAKYIDGSVKDIINGVVIISIFLWLLQVFGVLTNLNVVHIGH